MKKPKKKDLPLGMLLGGGVSIVEGDDYAVLYPGDGTEHIINVVPLARIITRLMEIQLRILDRNITTI